MIVIKYEGKIILKQWARGKELQTNEEDECLYLNCRSQSVQINCNDGEEFDVDDDGVDAGGNSVVVMARDKYKDKYLQVFILILQ